MTGNQWLEHIQLALDKVPTPNVLLLKRLFEMMRTIAQNYNVTNVTIEELAEMFSPCFFFSMDPKDAISLADDIQYLNSLITKMIKQSESLNFSRLPSKAGLTKKKVSPIWIRVDDEIKDRQLNQERNLRIFAPHR